MFAWRKQAGKGIVAAFSGKAHLLKRSSEAQVRDLHVDIGQLKGEKRGQQDFTRIGAEAEVWDRGLRSSQAWFSQAVTAGIAC